MTLYVNRLWRFVKYSFAIVGVASLISIVIAFTTGPFWGIYWLGTSTAKKINATKVVLLGGGGMPSESNLMRLWYAIEMLQELPDATLVIAIPGDTNDMESAICKMALYAEQQGVSATRIQFESVGANTRTQALNVFKSFYSAQDSFLLVTSPEHLRRAMLTFRKVGFDKLGGVPAFPVALKGDLCYTAKQSGKTRLSVPDVGDNLQVRYQFWNHLVYEVVLLREYCALAYYWMNDWI